MTDPANDNRRWTTDPARIHPRLPAALEAMLPALNEFCRANRRDPTTEEFNVLFATVARANGLPDDMLNPELRLQ